jgi:DNA-binding MarR family transcriptional regulator
MNANECIFFQLAKASQKAVRFWGKQIEHLNVTPVQGMLLNFLSEEDRVTSNHLGERTQLDSATLTGIIDRLEAVQLVERKPNPVDRRAILLCLTEKGRTLALRLRKIMEKANREFLSALNDDEEGIFRSLLQRVRAG